MPRVQHPWLKLLRPHPEAATERGDGPAAPPELHPVESPLRPPKPGGLWTARAPPRYDGRSPWRTLQFLTVPSHKGVVR